MNGKKGDVFASKWNFSPLRYSFGMAALNTVNAGALGAAAVWTAQNGGSLRLAYCAAAVGAFTVLRRTIIEKAAKIILSDRYSEAPGPALAGYVDHFVKRSGITEGVTLRVMNVREHNENGRKTSSRSFRIRMNYGAAIIPARYTPDGRAAMIIGAKTLELLTPQELAAVICHEISHVKNPNSPKSNSVINYGRETHFTAALASLVLAADPVLAAAGFGTYVGSRILTGLAGQFDELRADYNSTGQFPHKDALPSALNKIRSTARPLMYPNKASFGYVWAVTSRWLFGEHPSNERRAAAHERNLPAARAFSREYGIPLPD